MRVAVALLCIAAAGCGGTHTLARDEAAHLAPTDGLLAVVARTNTELQLSFCRDGGGCLDLESLTSTHPMTVVVAPAGHWCMKHILAGVDGHLGDGAMAIDHDVSADDARCFEVEPGVVTYPGDFLFMAHGTSATSTHVSQGWEESTDAFAEALATRYPRLRGVPVRTPPPHDGATSGGDAP